MEELRSEIWNIKSTGMSKEESILAGEMLQSFIEQKKKQKNNSGKISAVLDLIENGCNDHVNLTSMVKEWDISPEELEDIISALMGSGMIYSPRIGIYKKA
jgi:predicted transcriptional regulator